MRVSRQGRRGSKPLDASQLRELVKDDRVWCAIGVVRAREGAGSHWEKNDELGDVLVNVDLGPDGIDVWCRLGGFHNSRGVFMVPEPDTEVVVTQMAGDPREMPSIVASLSSGSVPSGADADILLVVNGKRVEIRSENGDVLVKANGKIYLGDDQLTAQNDGVVLASGIDSFTGSTYGALNNASTVVMAKKT